MTTIDKSKPVMITGATGYVAGWIVKELLDHGLTVHAPVRDPNNKEKLKYLNQLADNNHGTIKFFEADLLKPNSYDEAMKGCELVFHTASPFINKVKDPQRDLVDPAVNGTRNVLSSVNKTKSVKRVVLTSSCAAIYGDAKDMLDLPNGTATEEHWNTTSTLKHQAYSYSKVQAEKEAWKINKAQERWDLVVINPSLVIGPGINPKGTSESFNIVKQLGDGKTKSGVPRLFFGMNDVRDLAVAHFRAGFKPEAKGRHIISHENMPLLQLTSILVDKYGNAYPFPKKEMPKWLVWLVGPIFGIRRKMVANNVGYPFKVDNSKSKKELNMQYRPVKESIVDFFQQMIDNNVVK
ncbi:MAG: NAD-dependent epimerase/dehydratase family protein [Prolixibacteraceae bacterium]|jgi:nucleoside-diphosphate-sugar epimerase|nr:NAD-dependent epimerase/dehydratase family protein [Prolixibacteraceae bacterium]